MSNKGIVRAGEDSHAGHFNPFGAWHKTKYVTGSPDVFVNGHPAVRVGDKTECGDVAAQGSASVFINNLAAHRIGDATTGHDDFFPTVAETGSKDVKSS